MPDNIERLREAGFKINTGTPEAYEDVLRDLSEEEMDALTLMSLRQIKALNSVAEKLNRTHRRRALKRHWTYYILPP